MVRSALATIGLRGTLLDTMGIATRLAAQQLEHTRIPLERMLRRAGLSLAQIRKRHSRVSVAGQIAFLEEASDALGDPFLGFHLARDFDLRQIGLLYYVAASSDTLGDALRRMQRYCSVVSTGLVIKYSAEIRLSIRLEYSGIPRHSDRQQMEFLVTSIVRICRVLTDRHVTPLVVHFTHFRSGNSGEFKRFLGAEIAFGAESDEIIFDKGLRHLKVLHADQFLNQILAHYCAEEISHRLRVASSFRASVENAILPLLPHGGVRLELIAQKLGVSKITLTRRLSDEGVRFSRTIDELRQTLATQYLQDRSLTISQIAWLLGYQQTSAFTHACERWTGMTPREAREYFLSRSRLDQADKDNARMPNVSS